MEIEHHPFKPWLPQSAKLLMLGTFPPPSKRWAVKWFYPNFTNDMWRIFGIVFFDDKSYFVDEKNKTYLLDKIKDFLEYKGIAIYDTAKQIIRTKGTASDKDLEIVESTDLEQLLAALPLCKAVVTTGQLATKVFATHFGIKCHNMKMRDSSIIEFKGRKIKFYRLPSSSRAYPMKIENKSQYYKRMFDEIYL